MICKEKSIRLSLLSTKTQITTLYLLSKQGRTQVGYSTELTTESVSENFGGIARLLSP